jgi:hypothetical protein
MVRRTNGVSFYQSIESMLKRFDNVLILFEVTWRQLVSGRCVTIQNHTQQFDGVETPSVRIDAVQFVLIRLAALAPRVRVLSCATQQQVAATLAKLWQTGDDGSAAVVGRAFVDVDSAFVASHRVALRLLCGLPGITLSSAIVLLQRFRTIRDLVSADATLLRDAYQFWSIDTARSIVATFRCSLSAVKSN